MPDEIRSITAESCSVVTSPSERFSATSRSSRRMILPDRVFGSSGDEHDLPRLGDRAERLGHVVAQLLDQLLAGLASVSTLPRRIENATIAWPVVGSVAPTTAASATDGCDTSADSTSVVEMLWPETSMTSSTRPSSHRCAVVVLLGAVAGEVACPLRTATSTCR